VFRCRTERREPLHLEIKTLEDPVVVAFLNARDDQARARFLSEHGLLVPQSDGEILHSEVLRSRDSFAQLLAHIRHRKPAAAVNAVNEAIAAHRSFNLRPALGLVRKSPQLTLGCESLTAFMLMEVAMFVAHGVREAHCQRCNTLFVTGRLTGRRSHAKYCSDRCRMAAMRERQKA
jgi:hypothetical protein